MAGGNQNINNRVVDIPLQFSDSLKFNSRFNLSIAASIVCQLIAIIIKLFTFIGGVGC